MGNDKHHEFDYDVINRVADIDHRFPASRQYAIECIHGCSPAQIHRRAGEHLDCMPAQQIHSRVRSVTSLWLFLTALSCILHRSHESDPSATVSWCCLRADSHFHFSANLTCKFVSMPTAQGTLHSCIALPLHFRRVFIT